VSEAGREFREFAAVLDAAGAATEAMARQVVNRSALAVKNAMRADMARSRSFHQVAGAISYDIRSGALFGQNVIEAEIGPEKGSPGSLANIAYFGTSRGGGTVRDPGEALNDEASNFERALSEVIERSLR
jgi:hypothetical protein